MESALLMRRIHGIEIEDQPWCPATIRDAATDYLQFVIAATRAYAPIAPRLRAALDKSGAERILDLASGAGGPWPGMRERIGPVSVCLTDRFPNRPALARIRAGSGGAVDFDEEPVDATAVPPSLSGFRTLFSSFHHFRPDQTRRILADAVRQRQGIGVFEAMQRSAPALLAMLLAPLSVLLATPFIRPFRLSRLVWAYLIPLVPLVVLFDGIVSCLRTYTPAELRNLVAEVPGSETYIWEIGEERAGPGRLPITYLLGYPAGSVER